MDASIAKLLAACVLACTPALLLTDCGGAVARATPPASDGSAPVGNGDGGTVGVPDGSGSVPATDAGPAGTADGGIVLNDGGFTVPPDASTDADTCLVCGSVACVDAASDPGNCGACGVYCGGTCTGGHCVTQLAAAYTLGMAVDSSYVYFTSNGQIVRVPVDGGPLVALAESLPEPWALAIDDASVFVVAGDIAYNGADASVVSVPKGGGPVTTLTEYVWGGAFAVVAGGYVFWDSGGYQESPEAEVSMVSVDGGTVSPFAPLPVGGYYGIGGLAASGDQLYFTENGIGVFREPLSGGSPTLLFPSAEGPVVVAPPYVYASEISGGAVRMLLDGGEVTTLWTAPDAGFGGNGVIAMAVDETHLYWTTQCFSPCMSALMRTPISGGAIETLYTTNADQGALALDSASVYWSTMDGLFKMNK